MLPPGLERLRPFEPMRYLHLLYLLFFLIVGGLTARYILDNKIYRWILLFVPLSAGMFYAQRQMFPATAHIEWPGANSQNAWLQAFAWIRLNTPAGSLFALDPHYVELPGEDYHGFRALAERSVLADYDKDAGMAARVPRRAPGEQPDPAAAPPQRMQQLDQQPRNRRGLRNFAGNGPCRHGLYSRGGNTNCDSQQDIEAELYSPIRECGGDLLREPSRPSWFKVLLHRPCPVVHDRL